jgi:hypothetical protein
MNDADVEAIIQKSRIQKADLKRTDYLSSGSTLLNLACSGTPCGAFIKGGYHWMVGDSDTGKTFLMLTALAEAANNPDWDEYDLIFDDVENGALMDMPHYFGQKMADRVQAPDYDEDGEALNSDSIEDFYYGLSDRLDLVEAGKAKPFLQLLDSMDALSSKYEGAKFEEKKKAHRAGKKAKGDYGDGKAKVNSTYIRTIVRRLRKTKCSLIILSQTRDNIDAGMFESKKTHAGGRALKFYATWQLWSSSGGKITKQYKGKDRQLGIYAKVALKKNRLTGKEWAITVPIYHSHGLDNIESCIDYLCEEKHWNKAGAMITAPEFDHKGTMSLLIQKIEEDDLEPKLIKIVTTVWRDIEEAVRPERKARFS